MEWGIVFFFNSILLGAGLAMDAFSVSPPNGSKQVIRSTGFFCSTFVFSFACSCCYSSYDKKAVTVNALCVFCSVFGLFCQNAGRVQRNAYGQYGVAARNGEKRAFAGNQKQSRIPGLSESIQVRMTNRTPRGRSSVCSVYARSISHRVSVPLQGSHLRQARFRHGRVRKSALRSPHPLLHRISAGSHCFGTRIRKP